MNLYIVRNYTPIPDYVLYQLASSHVKNRYHYYYSSNLVAYNSEFLTPFIDVDRFCNSSDERTLYLSLKHFTQFMHGVAEYDILITRANELIKCTELLLTINSPTADEYIDDELF
jgi:predicted adenine nucleotide alpha hydrolase (AANH) superfamily ATPase